MDEWTAMNRMLQNFLSIYIDQDIQLSLGQIKGHSAESLIRSLKNWAIKNNSQKSSKTDVLDADTSHEYYFDEHQINRSMDDLRNESQGLRKEKIVIGSTMIIVNMNTEEINSSLSECTIDLENLCFVLCKINEIDLGVPSVNSLKSFLASHCILPTNLFCELLRLKHLSFLTLFKNRLESLPIEIAKLDKLENLNISHNFIAEKLDPILNKLSNLTYVNLNFNRFTEVPKFQTSLQRLNISHCLVSKLENVFVNDLPALEKLDISFNNIKKIGSLSEISPNLKTLNMSQNNITSTSNLKIPEKNQLRHIDISNNWLSGFYYTGNIIFSQLKSLDLSYNKIVSIPSELFTRCPELIYLNLFGNKITALPRDVSVQPSMRRLIFGRNKIKTIPNCFIDSNNRLEHLDVHSNPLGSIPKCFYNLKAIKFLDISRINLYCIDEDFCHVISNLTTFRSTGNYLKSLPENFRCLTKLQELQLGFNHLSNVDQLFTDKSSNLRILNLNSNYIYSFDEKFALVKNSITSMYVCNNPLIKKSCSTRIGKHDLVKIFGLNGSCCK